MKNQPKNKLIVGLSILSLCFGCQHSREGVACCEGKNNANFEFYEIMGPYRVRVDTTFHTSILMAQGSPCFEKHFWGNGIYGKFHEDTISQRSLPSSVPSWNVYHTVERAKYTCSNTKDNNVFDTVCKKIIFNRLRQKGWDRDETMPYTNNIRYFGNYHGKYSNRTDSVDIEITSLNTPWGSDTIYTASVLFNKIFPCQFNLPISPDRMGMSTFYIQNGSHSFGCLDYYTEMKIYGKYENNKVYMSFDCKDIDYKPVNFTYEGIKF